MTNQTIEQTEKQIKIAKEISSLIFELLVTQDSEKKSFAQDELKISYEKIQNYIDFKSTKLTTLQTKN
jgi:hypothetical protein